MQLLYPKHELQKQPPEVFCKCSAEALQLYKKRLQHRCFPVKFAKFLERLFWRTSANDCFLQAAFNFFSSKFCRDPIVFHLLWMKEIYILNLKNLYHFEMSKKLIPVLFSWAYWNSVIFAVKRWKPSKNVYMKFMVACFSGLSRENSFLCS